MSWMAGPEGEIRAFLWKFPVAFELVCGDLVQLLWGSGALGHGAADRDA